MDKNKNDVSDNDSTSQEVKNEKNTNKRKRNELIPNVSSTDEESDEDYRPSRGRSGCTYRKYLSKSGEHKCEECDKTFCKKEILKNHMLVHSDHKPHKCPKCTARFKRKGDYNRHMSMHERTKGRVHTCSTCKLKFLRKNEYSQHISTHGNLFPYKCKECPDAKFSNSRALRKHTGRPNNSRGGKCNVCDKVFRCRVALKKHTDEHDDEVKQGKCSRCYAPVCDKDELKAHVCSVKPFICRQCGDGFKTKFELVKHEMDHKALKPFRCKDCPEEFRTKAALQKHSLSIHPSTDSKENNCKGETPCNGSSSKRESFESDRTIENGSVGSEIIENGNSTKIFQNAFLKGELKLEKSKIAEANGGVTENGDNRDNKDET